MRVWVAKWNGRSFPPEWEKVDEGVLPFKAGRLRTFIAKTAFRRFSMAGITLYPYVIVRGEYNPYAEPLLVRHEFLHLLQQREDRVFYVKYILQWFVNFLRYRKFFPAYYEISYEKEARLISSNKVEFELFLKRHGVSFRSV